MLTENKIATSSRMMLIFDLGRVYECLWVEDILIKFLRSLAILWHSITHTSAPSVSKTIIHAVVCWRIADHIVCDMLVGLCCWQQWLNEHSYTCKSSSRWLYTTDIHQDCNCSSGRHGILSQYLSKCSLGIVNRDWITYLQPEYGQNSTYALHLWYHEKFTWGILMLLFSVQWW